MYVPLMAPRPVASAPNRLCPPSSPDSASSIAAAISSADTATSFLRFSPGTISFR